MIYLRALGRLHGSCCGKIQVSEAGRCRARAALGNGEPKCASICDIICNMGHEKAENIWKYDDCTAVARTIGRFNHVLQVWKQLAGSTGCNMKLVSMGSSSRSQLRQGRHATHTRRVCYLKSIQSISISRHCSVHCILIRADSRSIHELQNFLGWNAAAGCWKIWARHSPDLLPNGSGTPQKGSPGNLQKCPTKENKEQDRKWWLWLVPDLRDLLRPQISELNTLEPLAHFPSGSPANCTSQRAKVDICMESPDPPWPMRFRGELWIYGMEYQLDQGDTDEICTVWSCMIKLWLMGSNWQICNSIPLIQGT